ncbi:MAG: hypothetical protein OES84_04555, partial [Kiritimatiellaceae bacterium]|nr:hypothetical protein [Kiritimatiellaceae bacterium]
MKVHTALFSRLLCMLGIGILCHSVAAATPNVSQEAQVAFSEGKWSEGRQLLNNRLRDSSISSEERSEIFSSLAHFFCEYVGDYTSGYKYYQRARALRPNEPDFKLNEIRTLESEKKV